MQAIKPLLAAAGAGEAPDSGWMISALSNKTLMSSTACLVGFEHLGWRLYALAEYVNWCGHTQEFVPMADEDGCCQIVAVIGDAM